MSLGNAFLDRGRYEPLGDAVSALLDTPLGAGLELLADRPFDRLATVALGPGRGAD